MGLETRYVVPLPNYVPEARMNIFRKMVAADVAFMNNSVRVAESLSHRIFRAQTHIHCELQHHIIISFE